MAVEFALLRLLREQPSHGYALRKGLTSLRHVFPVTNVNVYPLLRDLEERGYVAVSVRVVGSRMRRNYEITERGRRALDDWVESDHDPGLPVTRDLASLKLLLASKRSARLEWLSTEIATAEAESKRLETSFDSIRGDLLPLARFAAEEQISLAKRRVAFLYEAQQLFEASGGPAGDDTDPPGDEVEPGSPFEPENSN